MLGHQVRTARAARGWTQEELAARVCVRRNSISRIENDERGVDVVTLNRLVDELELDPREALHSAATTAFACRNRPDLTDDPTLDDEPSNRPDDHS